jgi:hypothetical protein
MLPIQDAVHHAKEALVSHLPSFHPHPAPAPTAPYAYEDVTAAPAPRAPHSVQKEGHEKTGGAGHHEGDRSVVSARAHTPK